MVLTGDSLRVSSATVLTTVLCGDQVIHRLASVTAIHFAVRPGGFGRFPPLNKVSVGTFVVPLPWAALPPFGYLDRVGNGQLGPLSQQS